MVQGSEQYLEVDLQPDAPYGPHTAFNISFPAGETVFAVENGSPTWRGVEILDDGFGLSASMQRSEAAIKANLSVQRAGQVIGVETTGTMNAIPAAADKRTAFNRNIAAWLIGAAINRDATTGKLRSYSMRWTTPNISTEKFLGCKANTLTIEASEDSGTINISVDWLAAAYSLDDTPDSGSGLVFAKKPPRTAGATETDAGEGWAFARAYIFAQLSNQTQPVLIATARSLTITLNNNLDPAAPRVKTEIQAAAPTVKDTFQVTEFREQAVDITGNLVIDYTTSQYTRDMLDDLNVEIRLLGRHPQSRAFGVTAITQTPTISSNWQLTDADTLLTLDPSVGDFNGLVPASNDFLLIEGNVVMLENTNPTAAVEDSVNDYNRDIAVIGNGGAFNSTTIELTSSDIGWWVPGGTLFFSTTPGDYILYDHVMGVILTGVKIDTSPLEGGAADIIRQNLSFVSGQSDPDIEPILWAVSGLAHEGGSPL